MRELNILLAEINTFTLGRDVLCENVGFLCKSSTFASEKNVNVFEKTKSFFECKCIEINFFFFLIESEHSSYFSI